MTGPLEFEQLLERWMQLVAANLFLPMLLTSIMPLHQTRNMLLDDRIESYRPFFDHQWARELNEIAEKAPQLDDLLFDLMLTLKGISRAAALPQFAVDCAKGYAEGHQVESLETSLLIKVVNHIAQRIDQKIALSGVQTCELKKVMLDLALEFFEKTKGLSIEFPRQQFWDELVKILPEEPNSPKNELRIGIWAIQRNCYQALFFAYEDFVVRCVNTRAGTSYRVSDREFNRVCREALTEQLALSCWLDFRMHEIKQIRHALAHAGGQLIPDLKPHKLGIAVVDNRLQILPEDVANLYAFLKPKIRLVVEWASSLPQFA